MYPLVASSLYQLDFTSSLGTRIIRGYIYGVNRSSLASPHGSYLIALSSPTNNKLCADDYLKRLENDILV
jgi:hypothetical protein